VPRELEEEAQLDHPLPKGTTVLLRATGTAGRVLEAWSPEKGGDVRVETLAGETVLVPRGGVELQRGGQTPPLAASAAADWARLSGHVQLVTLVGSQAWNLAVQGSDEDRRGFFLCPFEALADLQPPPGQLEDPVHDGLYWELERLLVLLLRADPNALEALFGPVVEATPFGERVRAEREAFLTRQAGSTFGRYALAQLERLLARERRNRAMEGAAALWRASPGLTPKELVARLADLAVERDDAGPDAPTPAEARAEAHEALGSLARSLADRGRIPDKDPLSVRSFLAGLDGALDPGWLDARADRPKNAMHLLRILHSGLSILEGRGPIIRIEAGPFRDRLMAVRTGAAPLVEVVAEAKEVARRLDAAQATSRLPAAPPDAVARSLLQAGRRRAYAAALSAPSTPGRASWTTRDPEPPVPLPRAEVTAFLDRRPERALLVVASGSHSYGFPSADSDVDVKGIHVAPAAAVLGLSGARETESFLGFEGQVEIDYTSHELGKACRQLLDGNGNALEWALGRVVLREHARAPELRALARRNLHKGALRHYLGFSRSLLKEYERGKAETGRGRVKPLLYVFRTALTGVHLLRTGEVEPDLPRLLAEYPRFSAVRELVARKRAGHEKVELEDDAPWLPLVAQVHAALDEAHAASPLPDGPAAAEALSAWVTDVRLSEG
jgi:predicted nucleotidyltransferase